MLWLKNVILFPFIRRYCILINSNSNVCIFCLGSREYSAQQSFSSSLVPPSTHKICTHNARSPKHVQHIIIHSTRTHTRSYAHMRPNAMAICYTRTYLHTNTPHMPTSIRSHLCDVCDVFAIRHVGSCV